MTEPRNVNERLAILETQVRALQDTQDQILAKLETLLTLRNKGAGIFWLVSALFGTGMIGVMTWLIDSVRGH